MVDPATAQKPTSQIENISAYLRERDMYHTWAIDPLPVFIRRPTSSDAPICPTALQHGDFLEVAVRINIQYLRRNGKFGTSVTFPIVRIMRLLPASQTKVCTSIVFYFPF